MTVYLGSFVLLPAKPELTHIAADKLSGAKRVDNRWVTYHCNVDMVPITYGYHSIAFTPRAERW